MRYVGQGYEVRVPFPMVRLDDGHVASMKGAFEAEYRRFYGQLADGVPIEAVNWRVLIAGPSPQIEALSLQSAAAGSDAPTAFRPVRYGADAPLRQTPVFRRDQLSERWSAAGPAIIEEAASTTVVLPGWRAQMAAAGCLLLLEGDER